MWLEDAGEVSGGETLAGGGDGGGKLGGVVCVVINKDGVGGVNSKIKTPGDAMKRGDSVVKVVVLDAIEDGESKCSDGIFDVDDERDGKVEIGEGEVGGVEVEKKLVREDTDVGSEEMGKVVMSGIGVEVDVVLKPWRERRVELEDECAARADEGSEMLKAFTVGFRRAVDVEVVRVGGGDDGHERGKVVERAVELIGLGDSERGVGEDEVGVVVLEDAAEEGGAVEV